MEITDKIIFLDIDGVLNYDKFLINRKKYNGLNKMRFYRSYLCISKIKLVNRVCDKTGSKIVISSTWKNGLTLNRLQRLFRIVGSTFEIIDTTPNMKGIRGHEIDAWLADHKVDKYAIIDDDSDMLKDQAPNFFQTDGHKGLTGQICEHIIKHFKN